MSNDKLTAEWFTKVFEELSTLTVRVEAMTERQELLSSGTQERLFELSKKLEKFNDVLNGSNSPERGLIIRIDRLEQKDVADLDVRVDRLEQSESRRTWLLRATIVASLGCMGATIAAWLKTWTGH